MDTAKSVSGYTSDGTECRTFTAPNKTCSHTGINPINRKRAEINQFAGGEYLSDCELTMAR
ncbi:MAG: hypothetical protein P4M04_04085, partial [Acidobacteriota bacterium]|nr:hypothetical protein [Acidobacteriota bacterium]